MARDITVKFGDGTEHTYRNAPDTITPEQVSQRASQEFGKQVVHLDGGKKAESGVLDGLLDGVKNIGTGLAKGFGGLATMAGDAFADDPQTRMAVAAVGGKQPKVGDVSRMVGGMGYQPKTPQERLAQSTAAGVGGALFPGPGLVASPLKQMAIGGSAGLGAEVGSQLTDGNPIAGLAGGILGGGMAGLVANMRGNTPKLAAEALRDVNPGDLDKAKLAMMQAQNQGVPVNLSQAMPNPSNIDTIVDALANSRYGSKVTKQLRDQPGQVAFGMEDRLLALPGTIRAPQIVANNSQDVATRVIGGAKKQRQKAWETTFKNRQLELEADAMGTTVDVSRKSSLLGADGNPLKVVDKIDGSMAAALMPESAVSDAHKRLMTMAAERPNTGVGAELAGLASRLKQGDDFITDTNQLNDILKDASARLKSPDLATSGVDAGGAKFIGSTIDSLRKGWGEKFSPYRDANEVYSKLTDEVVNPLKKSVVGDIAGRRGALPDVEATKTKLTAVFNAGTVPGSKSSEILTMEKAFRGIKEGPESVSGSAAYQDSVKSWMAQKVSAASKQEGGRVDPNVAAHLEQVFMGNDTKAQGFKDMLVGLARSEGKPDGTYVTGMQKFLKVTSMAARRPGTVQGVSQQGAAEVAGRTMANAGGSTTVNPFRNVMLRWSERLQANAYKEMDRLLTSPEGVDMLQKLAKLPATSPAAQTAVATFLGTNASQLDEAAELNE